MFNFKSVNNKAKEEVVKKKYRNVRDG